MAARLHVLAVMEDFVSALPTGLDSHPRCTALVCPDCAGTLAVQTEGGAGYLHFRCRVGHAFSLTSLLACKEEVLEGRLWASATALEELAALLRDLERVGDPYRDGYPVDEGRRRADALDRAAAALRVVLDGNVPLGLAPPGRADGAC